MQEAPAVTLKLMQVFMEQGAASQKRQIPKQGAGKVKRLKKD